MRVYAPRIGSGTDLDPYRPDVEADSWVVVEETEGGFWVEILYQPKSAEG